MYWQNNGSGSDPNVYAVSIQEIISNDLTVTVDKDGTNIVITIRDIHLNSHGWTMLIEEDIASIHKNY